MKALLIIALTFISFSGLTQEYGYFGKKNTLSINGNGAIPLFYLFTDRSNSNYKRNGKNLEQANDLFDGGINISYTHGFSGSFAFGVEYDLLFGNVKAPSNIQVQDPADPYNYNFNYLDIKHEQLDIRTNVFMPKIEYTFIGSQLPFGINNQLGIGYSTTKVLEKDYIYNVVNTYDYIGVDTLIKSSKMINFDELKAIKGITIMYAFNVRTPINKHLMINYGIRYTLNLSFNTLKSLVFESSGDYYQNSFYTNATEIEKSVTNKRITSIMSLNLGLTYVF